MHAPPGHPVLSVMVPIVCAIQYVGRVTGEPLSEYGPSVSNTLVQHYFFKGLGALILR